MKKVTLIVTGLIFIFSFCTVFVVNTKYTCSGTLVSKHDVPIPGAYLYITFRSGSKETIRRRIDVKTDNDGNFAVNETVKSDLYSYQMMINTDSNFSWKLVRDSGDYRGSAPPKGAKNFVIKLK